MMEQNLDIRFKQRFQNLQQAYARLLEASIAVHKDPDNDLFSMALIKAFEMTFELSWKTMKDYLKYNGIEVSMPREVIKQAFMAQIIEDGQLWIDMLEDRNLMAHTYDNSRAQKAVMHIQQRYRSGVEKLMIFFKSKVN